MKLRTIRQWPSEKLSQRVLYVLMGLVTVIFMLFYLIGFDFPYEENPEFNAPLFTDAILWLTMALVGAAVALVVVKRIVDAKRRRASTSACENNVPTRRIVRLLLCSLVGVVALSVVVASSEPLSINGAAFTDKLWLKLADVFIYTGGALLAAAVAAVGYGATRYRRKSK